MTDIESLIYNGVLVGSYYSAENDKGRQQKKSDEKITTSKEKKAISWMSIECSHIAGGEV